MKNKELFDRTIAVTARAYQNDTLKHGHCAACVAGNLIAANLGEFEPMWQRVFSSFSVRGKAIQVMELESYTREAKRQIDSTGYTVEELAKIEYAFESAPFGDSADDWMFNGLMAVVDVLMEIHECGKEEAEQAKLLFVKGCS